MDRNWLDFVSVTKMFIKYLVIFVRARPCFLFRFSCSEKTKQKTNKPPAIEGDSKEIIVVFAREFYRTPNILQ